VNLITTIDANSSQSLLAQEQSRSLQTDLTIAQGMQGEDQVEQYWQVAEGFEEIFLNTMLSTMRKTTMDSGLTGEGNDAKIYRSMFDQELAKEMAKRRDFGLSKQIFEWLTRNKPELQNGQKAVSEAYRQNQDNEVSSVLQNYRFDPMIVNE